MTKFLLFFYRMKSMRKFYAAFLSVLFCCPLLASAEKDSAAVSVTAPLAKVAEGKVGEATRVMVIHVSTRHAKSPVTLDLRGYGKNQFRLSALQVPAGDNEQDVVVDYVPSKIGEHSAQVVIESPELEDGYKMIRIAGIAIDPANPPSVTISPSSLEKFTAKAGEQSEQTIRLESHNLAQSIKAVVLKKKVFRISAGLIYKNYPGKLKVAFAPQEAGMYRDTIVLQTYGHETLRIPLEGEAEGSAPVSGKEGDELNLSVENPVKELIERFEIGEKNKPLAVKGWKNVAEVGKRAWWHYTVPASGEYMKEEVAKVTPFDSKVEPGESEPCQMLLVTPPIDFKHAANKVLSFRVRGDYLENHQTDSLQVLFIEMADGKPQMYPINFPGLPESKDKSGEWMELQLDFAGQDLGDVGFFGFRFKSRRGVDNAATYYLDDVTFGRKDLPIITPSKKEVAFASSVGKVAVSEPLRVEGVNLQEPIRLKLGGSNPSKFKLSAVSLPSEGGEFYVSFSASEKALYKAYVKISSRGAADKYIQLQAAVATGIKPVVAQDVLQKEGIFDLNGKKVIRPTQGCYILNGKKVLF